MGLLGARNDRSSKRRDPPTNALSTRLTQAECPYCVYLSPPAERTIRSRRKRWGVSIRVLICDDVADLRALYRLMFAPDPDIEVVGEAIDGDQAVSMTNSLQPDLVLLDINMPVKNGLEALLEIRRQHPETKVIILTGIDDPGVRRCAADLGAVDYMIKGIEIERLTERVRAIAV